MPNHRVLTSSPHGNLFTPLFSSFHIRPFIDAKPSFSYTIDLTELSQSQRKGGEHRQSGIETTAPLAWQLYILDGTVTHKHRVCARVAVLQLASFFLFTLVTFGEVWSCPSQAQQVGELLQK